MGGNLQLPNINTNNFVQQKYNRRELKKGKKEVGAGGGSSLNQFHTS